METVPTRIGWPLRNVANAAVVQVALLYERPLRLGQFVQALFQRGRAGVAVLGVDPCGKGGGGGRGQGAFGPL